MKASEKTVLEFFAGIGLMRLGLHDAGWDTIWANDIDSDKEAMYRHHFVDDCDQFVVGDVHDLDPQSIPTATLATASFPCTDLSLAGARRGLAGTGSGAFWGFIDAIEGMGPRRPSLVLLENVAGFLTSHKGNDFRDACLALNSLGYSVDAFIVDAVHFVPQSRQRLFVVGSRQLDFPIIRDSSTSFFEGSCRPQPLANFIFVNPYIRWMMRDLPELPRRELSLDDIIEDLPPSSRYWWSQDRAKYLLDQMSERHRATAESMMNSRTISYGTVFRRVRKGKSMAELRTDGIAGCLRTPRGGSGRQILFVAGDGKYSVRLLTPRECARLMGADDYNIDSNLSLNKALFGFGDAVCVSVIRWIAQNYLNPLLEGLLVTTSNGTSGSFSYGGKEEERRASG